jgi:hypothetical protein
VWGIAKGGQLLPGGGVVSAVRARFVQVVAAGAMVGMVAGLSLPLPEATRAGTGAADSATEGLAAGGADGPVATDTPELSPDTTEVTVGSTAPATTVSSAMVIETSEVAAENGPRTGRFLVDDVTATGDGAFASGRTDTHGRERDGHVAVVASGVGRRSADRRLRRRAVTGGQHVERGRR